MKVLLVSRCSWTLFNFRQGLIKALLERRHNVIGGGAGGDHYEKKILALGIPFKNLPVDKRGINPIADLRLAIALYHWYREERPDVVHHFTIKPVIYGSIAARLAGVPRIINTITGLGYVYTQRKVILRWIVDRLYGLGLRFSQRVFFQNEDDRTLFVEGGLVRYERTQLVPGSGVDTRHFCPAACPRTVQSDTVNVLMVSRLLRDKGIHEFVEAARIVAGCLPNTRFLLLGEIDHRNPSAVSEQEVRAWENEGIVRWLGPTDDVRPVLMSADIVVLPSYREGTPRSLLEAAAMGKPVVATDVVGCREVVDHGVTGLLVPVRDPAGLAKAIMELVQAPDLRIAMGTAGRRKMLDKFDERIVIESTLRSYGGVA